MEPITVSCTEPVPPQSRIVLHVGCGAYNPEKLHRTFRGNEWREVRLDIDPAVRPDIVASITDMRAVTSGSVDAVWSSHNLEHLYANEVPIALGEFFRVLKPAGMALITLPDLQAVAELVAHDELEETAYMSPAGAVAPLDMIFGFRPSIAAGNTFMAHRTGFTAKTLAAHLRRAGFVRIRTQRLKFDLWAVGEKPGGSDRASGA